MPTATIPASARPLPASARSLIDQAFTRASGAERVDGNRVRLLRDAAENYPAWLDAIAAAERYVYFQSYIIRDDASGRLLADALTARAREGVAVRLLYDWLGALGKTSGILARPARSGRRGALLQPAPPREPARMGEAEPQEELSRGWKHRIGDGNLRGR